MTTPIYIQKKKLNLQFRTNASKYLIEYFLKVSKDRHRNGSQSIIVNWNRVGELLKLFTNNQPLPFSQINLSKAEEIRRFMLTAPL